MPKRYPLPSATATQVPDQGSAAFLEDVPQSSAADEPLYAEAHGDTERWFPALPGAG